MRYFGHSTSKGANYATKALCVGLAGLIVFGLFGCQFVGGLEELVVADNANGGAGGTGGSGVGGNSTSSSSSSSSGIVNIADVECGGSLCTVGSQSSCCADHYMTNSDPFIECVKGPPGNDGCRTSGGANGYETRIKCQLPSHCPQGSVCCGNIEAISIMTWFVSLSCTTTCPWPDTIVCDPMSPTNDCPIVNNNGNMVQTTCQAHELLPTGYFVCNLPSP